MVDFYIRDVFPKSGRFISGEVCWQTLGVEYQNWQISALSESYGVRTMMLDLSLGICLGQAENSVAKSLDGSTSSEHNSETRTGQDLARQVGAIEEENVFVATTWLHASVSPEENPCYWSLVKYLSGLAKFHPLRLELCGENSGQENNRAAMKLPASQMRRYGPLRMAGLVQRGEALLRLLRPARGLPERHGNVKVEE